MKRITQEEMKVMLDDFDKKISIAEMFENFKDK